MDLRKQKPSDRVSVNQTVNREGMGGREDKAGKGDRLYDKPEFRRAIEDISSQFQSQIRSDKGPREPTRGFVSNEARANYMKRMGWAK